MNGFERVSAALRGEKPDRVPIMLHNFIHAAHEAGFSQKEYREHPKNIAATFIKAIETYQYDGVLIDLDTATLAGAVGVPVDFPEYEPARVLHGCLDSIGEVSKLKRTDVGAYRYVQNWLEGVRKIKEYFKDDIYVRGNCDQAPFSLASMIRSMDAWMMDLCDEENQSFITELLEYCTDVTSQFVSLMCTTGAHMVSNGDSSAGPSMISPDMYRQYAVPYEIRVAEAAHKHGLPYTLHICGDTKPILPDLARLPVDAVELDYKTDIVMAHDLFKDKITFIGNIDPSGILAFGKPEDVARKTEELLTVYSDSPRFILNAGCAIPKEARSENIKAMIQTARRFGP